jgi:hypothetical protein
MNATMPTPPRESEPPEERIRERAYFLWIERGCPQGEDLEHWFMAKQQLQTAGDLAAADNPPRKHATAARLSIGNTLAAHLSDPTHRFHAPGTARDHRLDVVEGEARQRVRGRHFGGSLRAQPKKPK